MTWRDEQICAKLLAEISIIRQLLGDMTEQNFLADERTSRAVCMTLINIGELVKNITDELKAAHRDIPWRAISGMRDITAHKYHTLRKEDVFHTCVCQHGRRFFLAERNCAFSLDKAFKLI